MIKHPGAIMRRFLLLSIVLMTATALRASDWPAGASEAFVADVYPSRDLAMAAIQSRLGTDAKVVEKAGRLVATAPGEAKQSMTVAYVDKPWAADWSGYVNRQRGQVLIGRSPKPCTSEAEAQSAARQAVVNALLPQVRESLQREYAGRKIVSDKALSAAIASALQSRQLIRDRFVQRFSRPYGDVWSAAVLVDASPAGIRAITRDAMHLAERRIERGVGIVLAMVLLLTVLAVLYALLNWLTKGYFAWRLRFAAAATLLLGLVLALALNGT